MTTKQKSKVRRRCDCCGLKIRAKTELAHLKGSHCASHTKNPKLREMKIDSFNNNN